MLTPDLSQPSDLNTQLDLKILKSSDIELNVTSAEEIRCVFDDI